MKQSLAQLYLCFNSLVLACAVYAQPTTKAPWIERQDTAQRREPLQQAPVRNLADFITAKPKDEPWMNSMADRLKQATPVGEQDDVAKLYDMQVFISAGMPEGVLRHLFSQAMEFPAGRVRFVVRGFTPQKLGALIGKLRSLFPDQDSDHIVIEVDPNAFRAYAVDAVPVYLVKEGQKWFEVKGAQSLLAARENVAKRSKRVMGELYAIAEPDMLSVIEERTKNFDWQPVVARAQERAMRNLKPGFDLPTATRDTTTFFTPTFKVPHDIEAPTKDGKSTELLAKAGQEINLLQHTRLQVPVIVFDPSDKRQARMVKRWISQPEFANADLFVVGFNLQSIDAKTPVTVEIAQAYKRPIYPWLAKLNERMGVESVPSIVQQDGQRLRIRTFMPENF